jgi:hypothetical protein
MELLGHSSSSTSTSTVTPSNQSSLSDSSSAATSSTAHSTGRQNLDQDWAMAKAGLACAGATSAAQIEEKK